MPKFMGHNESNAKRKDHSTGYLYRERKFFKKLGQQLKCIPDSSREKKQAHQRGVEDRK